MIKEFEYKGIWWIPNNPENKVSGILKFSPEEGTILDLIGSFENDNHIEIILGKSYDGKDITLYNCFEKERSFNTSGFSKSSVYVGMIFVGAHFHKKKDIKFKELFIHYSHLDEWVNISGFNIKNGLDEKVIIEYKCPEPIQVNIKDYKISIYFQPTISSRLQKEVNIKQKTYIKVESSEEKEYCEYTNITYHIQNFLSLGIGEPIYPLEIKGTTEINKKEIIEGKFSYPKVEIFYKLLDISKMTRKEIIPFNMLFTFKDISSRFETFLKTWIEKEELLKPVYNLYFGTLYNSKMYLEHEFLSSIQAIESYHSRVYGGKYLTDEEYNEIYNSFISFINTIDTKEELKKRLKDYLKYGNEFSLRKRLKELIEKHQDVVVLFIDKKDQKSFINKVVVTRNYLTHYDKSKEKDIINNYELFILTQKLKLLLEICLLHELGFSKEEIKDITLKQIAHYGVK
jgi:hypothetical protein